MHRVLLSAILVFTTIMLSAQKSASAPSNGIDSLFAQAVSLKNQNRMEEALAVLDSVSKRAEHHEDIKALIDTYNQFASVYLAMDKGDNALFYWDRSNVLLKNLAYPYGRAFHQYIEAILLFNEGNNYQAIYLLNDAKNLNNDRNLLNHITLTEADVYLKIGKIDEASMNYNSLLVNNDPLEKDYLATRANLGMAKLNAGGGKLLESTDYAKNALTLAIANGFSKEQWQANKFLADTFESLGNYEESLVYNKNILALRDSVFTAEKLKAQSKTADRVQLDFMTDEISKQDKKIEELSASASRSELTAILTSAFLTIISLLAVSLYRNNQIKLKTNDLLKTKNNELENARDAAVKAMQAKTNFLSTVSHELRTPLYAVTGLTHLLLEENPRESQLEHLKSLKFSGDYLLNFINDILQINKIDAEKTEPLHIEFNLRTMLSEVLESLKQNAKKNNTKLVLDYDSAIPHKLLSDPLKLSQVFLNLVGNGLKFTKNGEVKVSARLLEQKEDDVRLYFEVKDNGIGVSQEKQKDIFDSFEQGSIQINREYGGTGLGLTIVKSLLGLFNSSIELESELGKGSTFYFEITLKSKTDNQEEAPTVEVLHDYDFKGLHLMVVEDNKINQVITKKMLAKKEISCDIANNGHEAVDLARENKYDAILMDIHMPGISGEDATKLIREFDQQTPIIALTAISLDDSLESFYAAGCNDVVTKPFKPEVFYQKIGENIFGQEIKNPVSS